jgi:hypothetical protein
MGKTYTEFFCELVEWSQKKDSYSIDDFIMSKGITDGQLNVMTGGKNSCFLAVGKATCQCLDNAYHAWKSTEISKDQFSTYLIQSKLFSGDVESFDRLQEEAEARSA